MGDANKQLNKKWKHEHKRRQKKIADRTRALREQDRQNKARRRRQDELRYLDGLERELNV